MTEEEWLACDDPRAMVKFLIGKVSGRKLRLLACNFIPHEFLDRPEDNWIYTALSTAEKMAEGTAPLSEVKRWRSTCRNNDGPNPFLVQAIRATLRKDALATAISCLSSLKRFDRDLEIASIDLAFVARVRELVGNPFRPITLSPSWLTSTVLSLAQGIYEDRAFDRMPILADALGDAGCDNEEILNHCRAPGPHCRGCFAVDLILGKE
jgi:hypothetical protein